MQSSNFQDMSEQGPKLIAKGISKRFGNLQALHKVDITIFPGRISAFVGPNGAGKTTLFHVLSGNLSPETGSVMLNGQIITNLAPWKIARKHMGKLFQDVRVFENISALDNIRVAMLSKNNHGILSAFLTNRNRVRNRQQQEEAMYWLEYVGLKAQAKQLGGELSFGQQKLLAIARLIAHKSNLLLLDEPTAALSPGMTQTMIELIHRLITDHKLSIALIEHNMTVVKELAFYIYFMHEGEIFCHGTRDCVLENPEVRELYMGLTGAMGL